VLKETRIVMIVIRGKQKKDVQLAIEAKVIQNLVVSI
jgi:hypothetical protein